MKPTLIKKNETKSASATWQRAFRKRLREQGLVPVQVYIRAEHTEILRTAERLLRHIKLPATFGPLEAMSAMSQPWTTSTLFDALQSHDHPAHRPFDFTLVRGTEPVVEVVCNDHGGLTLHLNAGGSRIFISAVLCAAESVNDRTAFNDACLRLNPITPLSNIGLQTTPTGDLYTVFGELSAQSPLTNILEEIDVLAHNALQVTEVLHPYIH